jgi:putative endonuclease
LKRKFPGVRIPLSPLLPSEALAKEGSFLNPVFLFMFYVYILKCADNTHYTGCSEDLKARKVRHDKGYIDSTKNKLPVSLVFYCAFPDKYKAFQFEKYLKSGSGIAFRNKHII